MSVNLAVLIIFFLLMILISLFYRHATLDSLVLRESEKVLFEENVPRVEQAGAPRSVVFPGCIVRVTDMRIIIAQKMLLRSRYALRHVIFYRQTDDDAGLKQTLLKGYILMSIDRSALKVEQKDGGRAAVSIRIPETPLTRNQYIVYETSRADEYMKLAV